MKTSLLKWRDTLSKISFLDGIIIIILKSNTLANHFCKALYATQV